MRTYTPTEQAYIEQHLPLRGHRWVAKRLKRTPDTVWNWANRRGIRLGDLKGWVRAADLSAETGVAQSNIMRLAERDGVMRRLGTAPDGKCLCVLVRERWAIAYATSVRADREGDTARDAGYLTIDQLVRHWRLGRGTILRGLNGHGFLAPFLASARVTRGMWGAFLLNPHDAERIRRELDETRAEAKRLVSTKSLAIEAGVKQAYAADLGRQYGGKLLLVGGRLCCFVTPATAELLRQRFRNGLTPGKRRGRPRSALGPKRCSVCGDPFERWERDGRLEAPQSFRDRLTCCAAGCRAKQRARTIAAVAEASANLRD